MSLALSGVFGRRCRLVCPRSRKPAYGSSSTDDQFSIQELATAVQYNLEVVVVVFDNPDFVAIAHAYGARGCRVESATELETAVGEAIAGRRPSVIVVPMSLSTEISPWRYLMPGDSGAADATMP